MIKWITLVVTTCLMLSRTGSAEIYIENLAVTAVFTDCFYVSEQDRSAGIAVSFTGTFPELGDVVSLMGTVSSTPTGERLFTADTVDVTAHYDMRTGPFRPLGMTNEVVGGEAVSSFTCGVVGGHGLNNVGLLVKTLGRVTYVAGSPSACHFYIDDSSAASDDSGHSGLRVDGLVPASLAVGDLVEVSGISSMRSSSGQVYPCLRPRRDSDIAVLLRGESGPAQTTQSVVPAATTRSVSSMPGNGPARASGQRAGHNQRCIDSAGWSIDPSGRSSGSRSS